MRDRKTIEDEIAGTRASEAEAVERLIELELLLDIRELLVGINEGQIDE